MIIFQYAGIGHPLSSGSNVIDYSVVSANMLTSLRSMTATVAPSIEECIRQTCSNLLGKFNDILTVCTLNILFANKVLGHLEVALVFITQNNSFYLTH